MIKYFVIGSFILTMGITSACSNNATQNKTPEEDTTEQVSKQQIFLADPTIFYDKGTYYLYGTHAVKEGFEVYTSTDLKNWEKQNQLALSEEDVFGDHGFWAPQVFKFKNKYYMAYTANEHIAIAQSDSPLGPFKQKVQKPVTDPDGLKNIDPYVFFDTDGKTYLYYVRLKDGNRIYMAELKDDLSDIKPNTITSCVNAVDDPQKWENLANKTWTVTEGPTVLKHNDLYYLFYSGNGFRSIYYALGYAIAKNPEGPWKKYEGNPILDKDMIEENGPGHGDFFQDKTGQYYYVFHTHFSDNKINPRRTALIKGDFKPVKNEPDKMKMDKNSFYYLKTK